MNSEFWTDRRVFITGHTGFKGAWLCLLLKRLGAEVHGFALAPSTTPSLFCETALVEKICSSTIGDVRDPGKLKTALLNSRAEVVIHLAAQPLVRESYQDPVGTYATNVMGTVHLLEAVRASTTVRSVVIVTTDKVYENKEWIWGYRETEPLGGYDPYSNSKSCAELVTAAYRDSFFNVSDYAKHGVSIASARSGNVIGGGDWALDRLVPDCIRAFSSQQEVAIRYPRATRPWQHVLEPLSGYMKLAEKLCNEGPLFSGAWNFGPDKDDSKPVLAIVESLVHLWGDGAAFRVSSGETRHETVQLCLDSSKARHLLSWKPKTNLETALKMTVVWFKEFAAGKDAMGICSAQLDAYNNLP